MSSWKRPLNSCPHELRVSFGASARRGVPTVPTHPWNPAWRTGDVEGTADITVFPRMCWHNLITRQCVPFRSLLFTQLLKSPAKRVRSGADKTSAYCPFRGTQIPTPQFGFDPQL
ncbi:hypothetical protein DPEC_G00228320 [Dallia pectoralis]|uniref:Uncharacterized protein n=1 Tax=Dallia pectoralis TaxID=75939 RepID=A0ACC2G0V9_DALPE|nr:hypothetical protein DPEC_G00228320 [Dallia pectoralis]